MKNKFFIKLIGVLLVIGCVFIGCENGLTNNETTGGNDEKLIGTWQRNGGMSLNFTADTWSVLTTQYGGSYTANNGNMTISGSGMGTVISGNYSITDNDTTLTFTNFPAQYQLNGTYTKYTPPVNPNNDLEGMWQYFDNTDGHFYQMILDSNSDNSYSSMTGKIIETGGKPERIISEASVGTFTYTADKIKIIKKYTSNDGTNWQPLQPPQNFEYAYSFIDGKLLMNGITYTYLGKQ